MSTVRQQLMTKVKTRLKTVLTANGYASNIGQSVYEWLMTDVSVDALPCVVIRDTGCDIIEDTDEVYHGKSLAVEIDIRTASATAPADMRTYLNDILKAIGTDLGWDSLAYNTRLTGDQMDIDQKTRKYGGVQINISIIYYVKKWED